MEVRDAAWAVFGLGICGVSFEIEQASPQVYEAMADWRDRYDKALPPR